MREAEASLNSLALRNARTFKFLSLRAQRICNSPFLAGKRKERRYGEGSLNFSAPHGHHPPIRDKIKKAPFRNRRFYGGPEQPDTSEAT